MKDEHVSRALKAMYEAEFTEEYPEDQGTSNEDERFIEIMNTQSSKEGLHHMLPLPFRNLCPDLLNNRHLAIARLQSIRRKMSKDKLFREEYIKFIEKMLMNGYARKCPSSKNDKAWYLPHHGVFQSTKGKMRVVFDCSVKYAGKSLNSELLQGPDLTNGLLGVLLRFRENTTAFMADIETMFYQVKVPPSQRHFQRFLWWPEGKTENKAEDYEMCVHTFGATSSPSCANFALRKTAKEGEKEFGEDAAQAVLRDFYIDDLLKSVENKDLGILLLQRIRALCHSGGFNLTKIVSNCPEIVNSVPPEHRALSMLQHELSKSSTVERALGVIWCLENDTLEFRISLHDTALTRRGMLSTISLIYDPYGTASPFLIKGRKILQEIACDSLGWDDPVSEEHRMAWDQWRQKLPLLNNLKFRRCFKSEKFGDLEKASLHGFSDAAPSPGYGVVFYLRLLDKSGRIEVSQVVAKSRVTPINKPVTLPRLELNAADLAAKVGRSIKKELSFKCMDEHYWVDSMVVLGYIYNDSKRFKVFVANRQKRIRSMTSKDQWKFIAGEHNPADATTRGISLEDKELVDKWLHGPDFLRKPEHTWVHTNLEPIAEDNPELKSTIHVHSTKVAENSEHGSLLTTLEERISCWSKIVRVLAVIIKFCRKCQKTYATDTNFLLCTGDTKIAETALLVMIQHRSFAEEIKYYSCKSHSTRKPNKQMRSTTKLWRLDPYVDKVGILRVGGRLRKSNILDSERHPVILPKSGQIIQRIIEHEHKQVKHSGRTSTINKLRSAGYWIISSGTSVRSIIHSCVPCRRLRGKIAEQKMADLPENRSATLPPFSYSGMDMFGPFRIKDGRKQAKRFVALFTCFASRAVHLETTTEMSTDSFIQALRRFQARRGPVISIKSDNGKNFIGAENEYRKAFREMDHEKINSFQVNKSCDWIIWEKTPPEASHMGGIWERQIRTVRGVLASILDEHSCTLNDESFRTFLTETEAIVNSRPLTVECLNDPTLQPLTPNHLLTLKCKPVLPPPGIFEKDQSYCRKRWRQVQHPAEEFWRRWKKEYLLSLQYRKKWCEPKRNLKVGDIVLIKESIGNVALPRQHWPLAKVVKTFPDETDGLVRTVELSIPSAKSTLKRPIQKLVLLLEEE